LLSAAGTFEREPDGPPSAFTGPRSPSTFVDGCLLSFDRFERMEETLQICVQMWRDNDGAYLGTPDHLAETLCVPPQ
jgi:hypothetical protein